MNTVETTLAEPFVSPVCLLSDRRIVFAWRANAYASVTRLMALLPTGVWDELRLNRMAHRDRRRDHEEGHWHADGV